MTTCTSVYLYRNEHTTLPLTCCLSFRKGLVTDSPFPSSCNNCPWGLQEHIPKLSSFLNLQHRVCRLRPDAVETHKYRDAQRRGWVSSAHYVWLSATEELHETVEESEPWRTQATQYDPLLFHTRWQGLKLATRSCARVAASIVLTSI